MLEEWFSRIWGIWMMGGWTMLPLCLLSLAIYGLAVRLLIHFSRLDTGALEDDTLRRWVREPGEAKGEVGEIIRYTQEGAAGISDIHSRFTEVIAAKVPGLDRRLAFLGLLVAVAPLLGLLGTVLGMLLTFRALATAGGKLTEQMAEGISQALFPPEVGLCVALPGLLLIHIIKRKRHEYEAFLARLESYTVQHFRLLKSSRGSAHGQQHGQGALLQSQA